ncbi:hypothetical protein [Amycolatopsis sp. NPDC059657]|uniref:hypothetical protein n=1 Tax=Amycolatopsis sp. NPDC059657 TaxID=3346899 RepID=UPI0036703F11
MATAKKQSAQAGILAEIRKNQAARASAEQKRKAAEAEALAEYARAAGAATDRREKVAKKVAALEAQIAKVKADADKAAAADEPDQAAALRRLRDLGNAAEDIGQLVGLSAKRVRALMKVGEENSPPAPAKSAAQSAASSKPAAAKSAAAQAPAADDAAAEQASTSSEPATAIS